MESKIYYIKIANKQMAEYLLEKGFPYIEEKLNNTITLYCFEKKLELLQTIDEIKKDFYENILLFEENVLHF